METIQFNHMAVKLNESNALLSKSRHVLNKTTLKLAYYATFESYVRYASLVWTRNTNSVKRPQLLQKKIPQDNVF